MNETKSEKQDKYEDDVDMPMSTTTTTTTTCNNNEKNNSNTRVHVEQTKTTTKEAIAPNATTNANANANESSKGESIDNVNNSNKNRNENDNICDCITCQRALYCGYVAQTENDNKNESGNNVFAEYARQCMYRECGTRDKNVSNMECENCSQVSCCRGCNIILCKKCRKLLNVLQCSYNDYDKNDKQSEKKENNKNDNKNDNNNNNEDDDNCNTFICSQACYKKILFKYNIMLRFNGLDSSLHVSIIQFKKLFMKPYLSGLYQSLILPNENEYKMMLSDMNNNNNNNNNENAILVNWNDINWEYVDKQDWFPFHECQGCKKHNCGCTDWTCCVHCRKYYCQECVDKKLHKCKLDECENFTCCQWEMWDKNCMYCNDYGKCQLIFCTKGHCDTHFIP